MVSSELSALYAVLPHVAPDAVTACTEWTARQVLAHLSAGAKERADLIEEKLAGLPERGTKPFAEREAPFLSLSHEDLCRALIEHTQRFEAAATALADRDVHATIPFSGTRFTAAELATHQRSEAALHRWDLIGTDGMGDTLLAQPELTRHGVKVLNTLQSVLQESPTARVRRAGISNVRIVLRSPDQPDVVLAAAAGAGRFEMVDREGSCDAVVTTDAAQRFLLIWGRWPTARGIATEAKTITRHMVERVLWSAARPWPGVGVPTVSIPMQRSGSGFDS